MDYLRIAHLVKEFRRGDRSAFDKLYSLLYKSQIGLADSLVKDHYIAEDIVQESFMYAFSNMNSLEDPTAFVRWMNRITYCNCVKSLRESIRRKSSEDNIDSYIESNEEAKQEPLLSSAAEEEYIMQEKRMDIQSAIRSLEPDTQALLYFRFYSGFRESEIAEIMGIPLGTVKSRLSNSKKKLKKTLYTFLAFNPFFFLFLHYFLVALKTGGLASLHCGNSLLKKAVVYSVTVAGVSAGVMSYVGALPPVITSVRLADYLPAARSQVLNVGVSSPDGISSVSLKENGEMLTEHDGTYSAAVSSNGTYTVTVTGCNGKTAEQTVSITNIDTDYPAIAAPRVDGDKALIAVSDAMSGIDWDRLQLTDTAGREVEAVKNQEKGEITCSLSALPAELRVSDLAGNWQSVHINYE